MSTTLIHRTNSQEYDVRPSKSAAAFIRELHKVSTDGSGDAKIQTKLDRIVGMVSGGSGTAAIADQPVIDLTSKAQTTDYTTTGLFSYNIKGTASKDFFIEVFGYYEGE